MATSSKTLCIKYLKITWQRALSCNYILLKSSNSLSFPRATHSCYHMHSKDKQNKLTRTSSFILISKIVMVNKAQRHCSRSAPALKLLLEAEGAPDIAPPGPRVTEHSKVARERPAGVIHVLLPCANIPLLCSICNDTALKFSVPLLSHL